MNIKLNKKIMGNHQGEPRSGPEMDLLRALSALTLLDPGKRSNSTSIFLQHYFFDPGKRSNSTSIFL
jgi:hypothetical protein